MDSLRVLCECEGTVLRTGAGDAPRVGIAEGGCDGPNK